MRNILKRKVFHEAIRFGIVGCIATILHYGLYYVLLNWITANIAYAIGYMLSFVCNFYLTSYFTFHTTPSWRKLLGLGGAHGVNFVLHMVLLNVALWLGIPARLAPLPVFVIVIPVNFLLVRFVFNFKRKK